MNAVPLMELLNLATGQPLAEDTDNRPHRARLAVTALFGALLMASVWGALAGLSVPALALSNALRVPVVVLLAALAAVPPGMLAWKLTGAHVRGSALLLAYSLGTFVGTLVMAALSPVVALYYHSSSWAGPVLALGSILAGILAGLWVFFRRAYASLPSAEKRRSLGFPVTVFAGLQLAALFQLVALAGPMLPERTGLDRGVDGIFHIP
jgi:hypothetical protein